MASSEFFLKAMCVLMKLALKDSRPEIPELLVFLEGCESAPSQVHSLDSLGPRALARFRVVAAKAARTFSMMAKDLSEVELEDGRPLHNFQKQLGDFAALIALLNNQS